MSLLNAIKISNDDAQNSNNPTEILEKYEKIRVEHGRLFDDLVKDLNEKFISDIKSALTRDDTEIVADEQTKLKFKLGNGNVYITFIKLPPEKNRTLVKKRALIERDLKSDSLEVVASPVFDKGGFNSKIRIDIEDLSEKIKKMPQGKITGTFIEEVKSITEMLNQNIDLIKTFSGINYEIFRKGEPIGGEINKGDDFKKILDRLFDISSLF